MAFEQHALYLAESTPPAADPTTLNEREVRALLHTLLAACQELQRRVDDLELSERLWTARHPRDLGIDY